MKIIELFKSKLLRDSKFKSCSYDLADCISLGFHVRLRLEFIRIIPIRTEEVALLFIKHFPGKIKPGTLYRNNKEFRLNFRNYQHRIKRIKNLYIANLKKDNLYFQ